MNDDFEIIMYRKADGTSPVDEFIDSLEEKMQAKIVRSIGLLKKNGYELREPHSKPLNDGIFELRTIQGAMITRVLYFFIVDRKIILTNGFIKKTEKTPKQAIELAKKYRQDYLERQGGTNHA